MMTATPDSADAPGYRVQIERLFKAPRERVWQAWTDPEQLSAWLTCQNESRTGVTADVRVGGQYTFDMHYQGHVYHHSGVYVELKPPHRLMFTWTFHEEGHPDPLPTLITVSLYEHPEGTRMVFTHEKIPNEAERDSYNEGWSPLFDELEKVVLA
jgi:uncharacterized protein YndB with AHSA1/START domain